jgi:hypothetical protein
MMKRLMKTLVTLVVLYVVICGTLFAAMLQSPDTFARIMKHVPWAAFMILPFKPLWMTARSGHIRVGDAAPDFFLESADHKSHFQLSSLREQKPIVLVFGSYT